MSKLTFSFRKFIIGLSIIAIDIIVYIIFGLLLMGYDDFYDESKGEYWSFESMTLLQKISVIGINIWNVINILAILYIVYRFFKNLNAIKTSN